MNYTMHCPVEGCAHVMSVDAQTDEEAVDMLIVAGDAHFAEVGHPMDQSMTPEMKKQMTMQFMKKGA